jgi:hypothetical protein
LPISIQTKKEDVNLASPFKFNHIQLEDKECLKLVKDECVGFDDNSRDSTRYHFAATLKKGKKATYAWASYEIERLGQGTKISEGKNS